MNKNINNAKPFLKWAGGKNQLLKELNKRLPLNLKDAGTIGRYVEPFVGGGAMFFNLKNHYNIKESILLDINKELVMAYQVMKNDHKILIDLLDDIEDNHLKKDENARKDNYYRIRDIYNSKLKDFDFNNYNEQWIERTSYFIFLNKTCFNGLFRQNKNGQFNVPFGLYKNPNICDKININLVNQALNNTEIICSDFIHSDKYIMEGTFVYLDPPYRPISKTSNFTMYSKGGFTDLDQLELSNFYKNIDQKGAYLMLSNSDPKNNDLTDTFFDNLYGEYNIDIVCARRNINRNSSGRGTINELIIMNY
ncbi:MAG: DNA adenine methylase [Methanobacterium sp.]|nr:DNA adenine methylase [Methanobacterium sp.]